MRRNRYDTGADIALVCMLGLIMALMIFLSVQTAGFAELNLVFCAQTVILLITYFTGSLTAGLALSGLAVLGYGSFHVYMSLSTGMAPPARLYFFLLWTPLLTLAFWGFVKGASRLSRANREMEEAIRTLSKVDEDTGLPNIRAYAEIMPIYMGIAKRYGLSLGVIAGRVAATGHFKASTDAIKQAIAAAEKSIRIEDEIFSIAMGKGHSYAMVLLMAKPEDGKVVLDRMKNFKLPEGLKLKLGYCPFSPQEVMSPQLLLERALDAADGDVQPVCIKLDKAKK